MLPCHRAPELIPTNAQIVHLSPSGKHLLLLAATGSENTHICLSQIQEHCFEKEKLLGTL